MDFDSPTSAVRAFGKRGVRAAAPPASGVKPAQTTAVQSPADDAPPSDLERFLAIFPLLTLAMIIGLAAIFALEQALAFDVGPGGVLSLESLIALGGASFDRAVAHHEAWRLFLAPLLHASSTHLVGNCVALAMGGFLLEPLIGRGWFALIFTASAFGGVIGSLIGNDPASVTVGASGAITGLVAAGLVMSFHHRADADDARKMRKRAIFLLGPALLPLFLGVRGHVDYYAHLGGALAGGAVALALIATWDGASFRPRGARVAARVSIASLAASMISAFFVVFHYADEAAVARTIIPDSLVSQPLSALTNQSSDLVGRYPDDPRALLIRAAFLVKTEQSAQAEVLLRRAMTMGWPARPEMEEKVRKRAQAVLSVVLLDERRGREAHELAEPICADRAQIDSWPMLMRAKLCPNGAAKS
jgi:rhomboid protease GluP